METVRTLLVDAFTDEPLAGNAAGAVPEAGDLLPEQRQAIARELSVSETAFLEPLDGGDGDDAAVAETEEGTEAGTEEGTEGATATADADYAIEYYTPTQRVDLCGHATVGTFAGLAAIGELDPGTVQVATDVGTLPVEVGEDGSVWMTQDAPEIRKLDLDRERIAAALGIGPSAVTDLESELPLAVSSTGLPWLLVPVAYLSQLGDADPDMGAVGAIAEEVEAVGIYAYTFDALERDAHVHARAFAPGAGVPEDPVTGTAGGAAGAFLDHVGAFQDDMPAELVIEQGHYVDRPGRVRVRTDGTIRVGGQGVVALDGELTVPPADEEEILEV